MADNARKLTDAELEKMEKHLREIYERANSEIGESWKNYMDKVGEQIKALQNAYDAAKESGDAEEIREAARRLSQRKRELTLLDKHYREMTSQLAQELANVDKTAAAYINGKLPEIYSLNYNETGNGIANTVKGYSFELVDANTVKRLATTDETLLPYKYVDGRKDVRWNTQKINAEVLQGIIQGESMDTVAGRLTNVLGMDAASAIRNARTTVTSAENKGRMDMLHSAKESGVITHKVWMATHDGRVREAHEDLDGQERDIDEPFENEIGKIMFPGDPDADPANVYNCRCTMIYKIVGFSAKDVPNETEGDNVLWNRDNFALMRDATQDIVDRGEYSHYGLRAQEEDTEKIGETMTHLSKNFGGDFEELSDESETLNGVSTIGYENVNQMTKYGGYEGRVVYLVGADGYEYGYDPGEMIMQDPVVLAKGRIENGEFTIIEQIEISGDAQVVETTVEQKVENIAANEAMQEYLDYKETIIAKYGEENMWREMTDAEMDKLEELERKAFKGY